MGLEFGLGARLTFAAEQAIQNVGKASRVIRGQSTYFKLPTP